MHRQRLRFGAVVLIAAFAALFTKSFLLDLAIVEGRSMIPTYRAGEVVAVLRCAYGLRLPLGLGGRPRYLLRWASPAAGDIVAAASPNDGRAVVKRIAAVGPLTLSVEAGRLKGGPLELVLDPGEESVLGSFIMLPTGSVYLLGDNLPESVDSRSYGPVSDDMIAGRVLGGPLFGRLARPDLAFSGLGSQGWEPRHE